MEGIPDDDVSSMEPVWLEAIPAAVLGEMSADCAVARASTRRSLWRFVMWGGGLVVVGFALGATFWAAFGTM